jgi:hypothetical protein
MEHIEQKFNAEAEFMQIISQGQLHKIEMYANLIDIHGTEVRLADRVRNAKNYAIIMNTLLRKAAEKGVVMLIKEMARKFTLLVNFQKRNRSHID